jgi:hypothetical protein
MAKVMNTVFGIGIAVILFIVVMLGTQVFYPEPSYDNFNCSRFDKPMLVYDYYSCPENITVKECNLLIKNGTSINEENQKEAQACYTKFNDAQKVYGKNLFIVNNVIGIILVIVSLFLFSMTNIAAGTAFSGLALIIYGFMRGWQGTGDVLKFIVSLIVTILFIIFAVIVNKRYSSKRKK